MAAVGLVVLMIAVFGVFVAHGGDLAPVIKAAPWEFAQIFGAAVAAALISNSGATVGAGFSAGFRCRWLAIAVGGSVV
mgnify:CR=1 FL=1